INHVAGYFTDVPNIVTLCADTVSEGSGELGRIRTHVAANGNDIFLSSIYTWQPGCESLADPVRDVSGQLGANFAANIVSFENIDNGIHVYSSELCIHHTRFKLASHYSDIMGGVNWTYKMKVV